MMISFKFLYSEDDVKNLKKWINNGEERIKSYNEMMKSANQFKKDWPEEEFKWFIEHCKDAKKTEQYWLEQHKLEYYKYINDCVLAPYWSIKDFSK